LDAETLNSDTINQPVILRPVSPDSAVSIETAEHSIINDKTKIMSQLGSEKDSSQQSLLQSGAHSVNLHARKT